ncbi:MAG: hypothetical protein IPK19_27570 [Chloroflexi bacterium]|nr:hypothetical protein [Chloroflexota bacterium]
MREKTLREISVDTAILARLEDRLAVLDRLDERLKRIERLLTQWPLPDCHSETGFNFQDYLGALLKCPLHRGRGDRHRLHGGRKDGPPGFSGHAAR